MQALYIVGTPLGNMDDISVRAVKTLADVDAIIAEDTRVTKKILDRHAIVRPLLTWHEHSGEREWSRISGYLSAGKSLAYATDAGTPGVSDPGGVLVAHVLDEFPHMAVVPIPGPSSLTAAISVAGIPLHEFVFLGFLPHKKGRQTKLTRIEESAIPVILFESVHRIGKLLGELASGSKRVIVCRELTKKFETVYRGTPQSVLAHLAPAEVKGEFVVIIY